MTGEITLRGKVLPVGGVKEKVLAARRAKIPTIIVPEGNRKHLEEIPRDVRKGLVSPFRLRRQGNLPLALEPAQDRRDARRDRARGEDPGRYAAV